MKSCKTHKNFLIMLGMDMVFVTVSWYGTHLLRFNFQMPGSCKGLIVRVLPLIVLIKIVTFYFFDLYQAMWRYTSLKDLFNMIKGFFVASLILLPLFTHGFVGFVRSAVIIDWGVLPQYLFDVTG